MEENPHPTQEQPADQAEAGQVDEKPAGETGEAVQTPASATVEIAPAPEKEAPGPAAPPVTPPAPVETQKPARSWLYRLLYAMFSPETRLGRILRPVLRWTAAIAGLFALGMLATYLLLYAPTNQQLAAARSDLQSARAQATQTGADLATAQKSLADLQTQYNTAQSVLKKVGVRISLLQISNQVAAARLALVNRDGAAAQKSLGNARSILDQVLPDVKGIDANAATQLDSRLTLVVSELNDPATAQADLALLATRLDELDNTLK